MPKNMDHLLPPRGLLSKGVSESSSRIGDKYSDFFNSSMAPRSS
jgi:hypothetical protein